MLDCRCGSYPVEIKTVNGSFDFNFFRIRGINGRVITFERMACLEIRWGERGSYESTKLKDFVNYYATKISYENVYELSKKWGGGLSISDQRIQ